MEEQKKLRFKEIKSFKVYYRNEEELKRIYQEIFKNEKYKFLSSKTNPVIIDCGSHTGLSILYFKSYYPKARIIGFEPNPENFVILKKNILVNKLKDVRVFNYGLSNRIGKTFLRVSFEEKTPWNWGDTIVRNMWGDEAESKKVEVKTVKLSSYIKGRVDFIGMDIEGSEQKVLEEIQPKLQLVGEVVLEFHGTPTTRRVNDYWKIKNLLEKNGFEVKVFTKDKRLAFPDFVAGLRATTTIFNVRAKKEIS